ncbi:MAG: hypothetical protein ACYTEG_08330 [Planctomycetota bacterium]|jgi:hypothetical protein
MRRVAEEGRGRNSWAGFRWLLFVIGLPAVPLAGLILSEVTAALVGVWDYYVAAVLMPVLGLGYAWLVAPEHKLVGASIYYGWGLLLAYVFACPAIFPEGHVLAYDSTYVPFLLTASTATTVLVAVAIREGCRFPD